ncbi:MAG: Helix-turn-helix domain [Blastocatellia bacterium]
MNEPSASDRIRLLEKELAEMRVLLTEVARKQAWPQYLTRNELAELLQISPRTIDDWVSEDRIPYHKAGNSTRFLISEIVQWTAGRWSPAKQAAPAKPKSRPARKRRARTGDDKQQLRAL